MRDVYINSLGAFLPGAPVQNADMEEYLGFVHGKRSRHRAMALRKNRIRTRHYALDKGGTCHYSSAQMASKALESAISKSEISKADLTYLAASSTLGDILVPGLASHIHALLKIHPIEVANFQSVCASVLMALKSAWLQVRVGEHECASVTGVEFSSRYFRPGFYEGVLKFKDGVPYEADFLRFTLSDGGGAAIIEGKPNSRQNSLKIHWIDLRSYADRFDTCMLGGGVRTEDAIKPWSQYNSGEEACKNGAFVLSQDFELMKRMIPVWVSHYLELIDKRRIVIEEIDHVCSHYSSHSLREETISLLKKSGAMIPEEKWFSNLYTKGNTGTASILIMLEELFYSGVLQKGEKILCHVPESGRGMNGFMLLEVV
jgi:3-oxoacyl-[acyl-carrier-protein] synthase-3